jgi:hypothetical protein
VQKIPEEQYKKAIFHTSSQLNAIWNFARCYGLDNDVNQALEETLKVVEQFGMVVRGVDKPIYVRNIPKPRPTD